MSKKQTNADRFPKLRLHKQSNIDPPSRKHQKADGKDDAHLTTAGKISRLEDQREEQKLLADLYG